MFVFNSPQLKKRRIIIPIFFLLSPNVFLNVRIFELQNPEFFKFSHCGKHTTAASINFSGFLQNLYRFVWVLTSTSFNQPHDICFGLSPFLVRILSDDSRILENQLVDNPDINSVRNL